MLLYATNKVHASEQMISGWKTGVFGLVATTSVGRIARSVSYISLPGEKSIQRRMRVCHFNGTDRSVFTGSNLAVSLPGEKGKQGRMRVCHFNGTERIVAFKI